VQNGTVYAILACCCCVQHFEISLLHHHPSVFFSSLGGEEDAENIFFKILSRALSFIKMKRSYKLHLQTPKPDRPSGKTGGASDRGFRWEGFSTKPPISPPPLKARQPKQTQQEATK
jgi:hypothetical protein